MDLLHRLSHGLAIKLREHDTIDRLNRLHDRSLADLDIHRTEIRPVAKLAARLGPNELDLAGIVAQVRWDRAAQPNGSQRLLASLTRAADRIAARETVVEYQPRVLDRLTTEAHRARDAAVANLLRKVGGGIAASARSLAGPVVARVTASELFQRLELAGIRRREFQRLRTQLESYSDRELMADLRLVRSEIDDVAAEGAQRLVDAVVRNGRGYRRAAWRGQTVGAGHFEG